VQSIGLNRIHDLGRAVFPDNQGGYAQRQTSQDRHQEYARSVDAYAGAKASAGRQIETDLMEQVDAASQSGDQRSDDRTAGAAHEYLEGFVRTQIALERRDQKFKRPGRTFQTIKPLPGLVESGLKRCQGVQPLRTWRTNSKIRFVAILLLVPPCRRFSNVLEGDQPSHPGDYAKPADLGMLSTPIRTA
jgi:hypothetical protein